MAGAAGTNVTCYRCNACPSPFNRTNKEVQQISDCAGCIKVRINAGQGYKYSRICVPSSYSTCESYTKTKEFDNYVKLKTPASQSKYSPYASYCCNTNLCNYSQRKVPDFTLTVLFCSFFLLHFLNFRVENILK